MGRSMSGTLFVVATPIGNLEDITLRALRVLREADLIAAEDTRRTAKLLAHHGIATPSTSFHQHNSHSRTPTLLSRLAAGERIALVTDAGTPGVSDPGVELVQACVKAGIPVDPIPGPSAPLAAAIASGFPLAPFTLFGFPPNRSIARSRWLADISTNTGTLCFFEAPHRIARTLAEAATYLGQRPVVVARELTKVHQEFVRGTAAAVAARLTDPRGEFTVVIGPAENGEILPQDVTDEQLARELGLSTDAKGTTRREAINVLAEKYGRRPREVYAAVERARKGE
jgi:16S rRNA (cytidine1402-2'-O)-methyltransferase